MSQLHHLTLEANSAILLVIDIQERLAPAIHQSEAIISNASKLIQIAQALQMPVLATEQYPKGLGPTVPELQGLLNSTAQFAAVFTKLSFSALTPEVIAFLESAGRRQVIIAGMETHVCVFQTARALQNQGYQVFLAQDAVGSRAIENKQNGLDLIRACGATITNVETILFDLLKEAGTPAFKTLSKLIK